MTLPARDGGGIRYFPRSQGNRLVDAVVTLLVHAGVAASDAITCARLGKHARGESHSEALSLLGSADRAAARHLRTLLTLRTKAGYSHTPVSTGELKKAQRAITALVNSAESA